MTDNDALEMKMHQVRTIGEEYAKAKAQMCLLEHGRKILLATIMKEVMLLGGKMETAAAQEREARADQRYIDHITALSIAVGNEAKWQWEKKVVELNFETWKTKMINQTVERKSYA
jgi:hypothetical protein|tara:strand:+ start:2181 stop:2528 length:348 start_codon:yes stop_codon:yes gene_type:complete